MTAEIGDPKTLEGLLGNLLQDSPDEHEAMIFVTDAGTMAGRRRASSVDLAHFAEAAGRCARLALAGEPSFGTVAFDGRMYSVIVVPVSAPTGAVAGALAVGIRISESTIKELRLSRTEILLVHGTEVLVATLPEPRCRNHSSIRSRWSALRRRCRRRARSASSTSYLMTSISWRERAESMAPAIRAFTM
ncbi:MAG: hypothetical protein ACREH8_24445 [Opitutaceae bacterium]